ncbi:hypothetical protein HPP92_024226 [Vanilla planifolia]|uniref:Uncharacterized protein n=1 Tax=Vanilla planifolia TaxID=51239 RepID=A0A835PSD8_VANPL|nr:hypothetical protein HPP92_024542 [Vanilla planifolia]KAG0456438.1 hypothetical protein HPP92_024226 [Vanilla planifolia]
MSDDDLQVNVNLVEPLRRKYCSERRELPIPALKHLKVRFSITFCGGRCMRLKLAEKKAFDRGPPRTTRRSPEPPKGERTCPGSPCWKKEGFPRWSAIGQGVLRVYIP